MLNKNFQSKTTFIIEPELSAKIIHMYTLADDEFMTQALFDEIHTKTNGALLSSYAFLLFTTQTRTKTFTFVEVNHHESYMKGNEKDVTVF